MVSLIPTPIGQSGLARIAVLARPAMLGVWVLFCSALPCSVAAPSAPQDRVNVVVILVDDLGWADLGCYGSRYHLTPELDRLAAQGTRFTQGYAACAVCSPTRAALLTGRYPARIGITDWIRARFQGGHPPADGQNPSGYTAPKNQRLACPRNPLWMEHEEVTIAELLRASGYATCHIGKWHLGMDEHYPEHQGFDLNFGGCDYGQPPSYFDPYRNQRLAGIPTLSPRQPGEYLTDREADDAVAFIRQHRHQPFLLYLAHYAVHTPIQAKPDVVDIYQQRPVTNQDNASYAAMIQSVDEAVGRVLNTLAELQLEEQTLVIVTSDNGGLRSVTDNAPLRSGKGYPYEGGIRVPLLIRWPTVVPAKSVSTVPVCSIDLFPTIAAATGVSLPQGHTIDGLSLLSHLRSGGTAPIEREQLVWHFPHYRGKNIGPYSVLRYGGEKLIKWYDGPRFELYAVANDIGETTNLATVAPSRVQALHERLRAALSKMGAKLPR